MDNLSEIRGLRSVYPESWTAEHLERVLRRLQKRAKLAHEARAEYVQGLETPDGVDRNVFKSNAAEVALELFPLPHLYQERVRALEDRITQRKEIEAKKAAVPKAAVPVGARLAELLEGCDPKKLDERAREWVDKYYLVLPNNFFQFPVARRRRVLAELVEVGVKNAPWRHPLQGWDRSKAVCDPPTATRPADLSGVVVHLVASAFSGVLLLRLVEKELGWEGLTMWWRYHCKFSRLSNGTLVEVLVSYALMDLVRWEQFLTLFRVHRPQRRDVILALENVVFPAGLPVKSSEEVKKDERIAALKGTIANLTASIQRAEPSELPELTASLAENSAVLAALVAVRGPKPA